MKERESEREREKRERERGRVKERERESEAEEREREKRERERGRVSGLLLYKIMLMRDTEGRKKEASKAKSSNKAKQHNTPKAVTFSNKMNCLGCGVLCCFTLLKREGRKKEAGKVKQTTRQSNTAHPNELPRVGLEPTTLYTLSKVLVLYH